MRFAIDKEEKRIFIDNTHVKEPYFCPVCGEQLILKKGDYRAHHFAHQAHTNCSDTWHYDDMSDWHLNWQERFPPETQEIVKEKDGVKHRADVLIEDKKVVIEFQHSNLSPEEFDDRNHFYTSLGYKVIWVFDLSEQYDKGSLDNYKNDLYKWTRPRKTFNNFIPKDNPNIELYFQIEIPTEENECYLELKKLSDDGYNLGGEDRLYLIRHKTDEITLIKVTWAPDSGFERFGTDGYSYNDADLLRRFIRKHEEINTSVRLGDLADYLLEMYSRDHTAYYFGCPRSKTHLCGDNNIDISREEYEEKYPCSECEFSTYDDNYIPKCKKRFMDLGLSGDTQVEIISRNSDGFINKLSYVDDDGKHDIELPTFINSLNKNIYTLWRENKYKVAVFKNTRTGMFVKILSDPSEQVFRFRKVKGYFSRDQYSFNGEFTEIYGCDKPEWICVWSTTK